MVRVTINKPGDDSQQFSQSAVCVHKHIETHISQHRSRADRFLIPYLRIRFRPVCTIRIWDPKVYLRGLPRPPLDTSLRGQLPSAFGVSSHHGAAASVGGFSRARSGGWHRWRGFTTGRVTTTGPGQCFFV